MLKGRIQLPQWTLLHLPVKDSLQKHIGLFLGDNKPACMCTGVPNRFQMHHANPDGELPVSIFTGMFHWTCLVQFFIQTTDSCVSLARKVKLPKLILPLALGDFLEEIAHFAFDIVAVFSHRRWR